MDNRNNLFGSKEYKSHSDAIDLEGRLDIIQNMIKAPISIWISKDASRIKLLQEIIKNSFAINGPSYQDLPNSIKNMLQNPKHFLRTVEVENPEQTMRTLVEQASSTAISDYMNSHPEYEEMLEKQKTSELDNELKQALNVFNRDQTSLEKMFAQLPDEQIEKAIKALHAITQNRHPSSEIATQADLPSPTRPKVR